MVGHHVTLDNLNALPFAKIFYVSLKVGAEFIVNDFSTILWREYKVILAKPFRVS